VFALAAGMSAVVSPSVAGNPEPEDRSVVLSADDVTRLGIRTAAVEQVRYTPHVRGYGVVVDLGALAQAEANIATARAAARQSRAELQRQLNLFANRATSAQAMEAAERQSATDDAQLLLAERQEVVLFGPQAPWGPAHRDTTTIAELSDGRAVLVKATFPLDTLGAMRPAELSVTHLGAQQNMIAWGSRRIWNAPADPTIPGESFFALVRGSDLQAGEHVLVTAPTGPSVDGVRIPSEALLLSNERTWCYLETSSGSYRRLQLDLSRPLPHGYFVMAHSGITRSVVVRGTGLLLARELGAAARD
jgi:hypothetical protein